MILILLRDTSYKSIIKSKSKKILGGIILLRRQSIHAYSCCLQHCHHTIMPTTRRTNNNNTSSPLKKKEEQESKRKRVKQEDNEEAEEKNDKEKIINKFLFKSEPETRMEKGRDMKYAWEDLVAEKVGKWDGVRSHQAKNVMKSMKIGDLGFFYHSNCKIPGIVGVVEIVKEAYPDFTAWDEEDPHFDPKSKEENPTWYMVDVKPVFELKRQVTLKELKELKSQRVEELEEMMLLRQGRLSVQPVDETAWNYILELGNKKEE